MNKNLSKKGGASSHLRPCKVAFCDKHNERLDANPSNKNIRPQFSVNNSTWKAPDCPNLVTLDRQIRKDYLANNGRHLPNRGASKASPLKESVTLMPGGGKDTDIIQQRIIARVEKEFGIRCIRRYNHRDEYCEETGTFNWHGHEVWDMYDHERHRMIVLSRNDCRKWQDIVAEETGMPRGTPAYETRRKWLSANEYKLRCQQAKIDEQEKIIAKNEEKIENTEDEFDAQLNLKESLDKHIRKLESEKAELKKEKERLEEKNKELIKTYKTFEAAFSIGKKLNRSIVAQLQDVFDRTSDEPMEVVGFFIETQMMNLISPTGQPIEHEVDKYVVKYKNSQGEIHSVVANKDDFYKASNHSLQRGISQLFANLNSHQMSVLKAVKQQRNKTGIHR